MTASLYGPPATRRPWNVEAGYQQLAYRSVLPIIEVLDAGQHDVDALLAVAFSPLVHAVLECHLQAGAIGVVRFLQRLCRDPHPDGVTRFVEPRAAWALLDGLPKGASAAVFDLRPGGGPEFERFPYVPLLDRHGRIPCFHQEVLPLVVAVLRGWGATLLVVHPCPTAEHPLTTILDQAQARWTDLTHTPTSNTVSAVQPPGARMQHGDKLGQKGRFVRHTTTPEHPECPTMSAKSSAT